MSFDFPFVRLFGVR